tara:strand:- start:959 stop:1504 length:546 start_codon:yes stop_codon:yes gene_type:complete
MFIIQDGFYRDPHNVRQYALDQQYETQGNYPGLRTEACGGEYFFNIKKDFERILNRPITYWARGYNTAFQYTTEGCKTWIHHDATKWAAVVYLTPDAPRDSGTGVYIHKPTGIYEHSEGRVDFNEYAVIEDEWELLDSASNVFNRLVLYSGMSYHRSILPGFGTDKYTGRLFQTFFFDTAE